MDWRTLALMAAGVIGAGVALIHGMIVQRVLVQPLAGLGRDLIPSGAARRLIPALLHTSTFAWFAGGLALTLSAIWSDRTTALVLGALVGMLYLGGAAFNCWATRGRHPGWIALAIAVFLIVFAAAYPGS